MDSPDNGQLAEVQTLPSTPIPPVGYKLDVTPPTGYVPDSPPTDPYPQDKPTPLAQSDIDAVSAKYPAYTRFLPNVVIHPGTTTADDDRQVETYPPSEEENPNPGRITIQPYHKELLQPEQLHNTVAGEMLHIIGGVDPETGKPNDPDYYRLKRVVGASRTPHQIEVDHKSYDEAKKQGETRSYQNWFRQSRLDEYIMGYVTPDKTDEWRKGGWYKDPKMAKAVEDVRQYLTSPPKKPDKK